GAAGGGAAAGRGRRGRVPAMGRQAGAGAMMLKAPGPPLGEIADVLDDIREDARRAGDVIERIRGVVSRKAPSVDALDINALVSDVVRMVSDDAAARTVDVIPQLCDDSPRVAGDRAQLTEDP